MLDDSMLSASVLRSEIVRLRIENEALGISVTEKHNKIQELTIMLDKVTKERDTILKECSAMRNAAAPQEHQGARADLLEDAALVAWDAYARQDPNLDRVMNMLRRVALRKG